MMILSFDPETATALPVALHQEIETKRVSKPGGQIDSCTLPGLDEGVQGLHALSEGQFREDVGKAKYAVQGCRNRVRKWVSTVK